MAEDHFTSGVGPLQTESGQLHPSESLEPLFPGIPAALSKPMVSCVEEDKKFGANVSPDYKHGPGLNADKYKRVNSFCPGVDIDDRLKEVLEASRRANSAPELTGIEIDSSKIKDTKKDYRYKIPKLGVGRRGSRESRSKTKASKSSNKNGVSKVSKPRSLSPNQKFGVNGRTKLEPLRGMYPTRVLGVVEATGFDSMTYSGVVKVDFRGKLDPLDSIGVNVAKSFPRGGEDGGTIITPGKVVGQKHMEGRLTGVKYRIVYLNGTEETVNEEMLRYYSGVFNSACMSTDVPLLPIIVRMM